MGITEEGIKGEKLLFGLLKRKGFEYFQPDAIGLKDNVYYVFESKHQEYYKAPPFNGHGLPKRQVEARIKFQKRTGIKSVLVVFEKPYIRTKIIYYQFLEILEKSEYLDTHGKNPRRIYPLKRFLKIVGN